MTRPRTGNAQAMETPETDEGDRESDEGRPAEGGAERYGGDQDSEGASRPEQPGTHDDDDQAEG